MRVLGRLLILACAAAVSTVGITQAPPPPSPPPLSYGAPIAVTQALQLIDRGMKQSAARGFKMAIAVVDPSGELVAFARMDDVPYASVRIAQQKARSAARFRMPTLVFEERVLAGRTVLLSSDEVIAVGGGVPIIANGKVIGALGVSGASSAEDAAMAAAVVSQQDAR